MPNNATAPVLALILVACGGGEGSSAAECADGVDQDGNDDVDCADRGCRDWAVCALGESPLAINEFVANNAFGITDENGEFEDWIELYNASAAPFPLAGLTITDDRTSPAKAAMNPDLVVPGGGYLLLWADQDAGDTHLPFKLAREGGAIGVYAADGSVIDAVEYGQQSSDVALARVPDGYDRFIETNAPTPRASNGGER